MSLQKEKSENEVLRQQMKDLRVRLGEKQELVDDLRRQQTIHIQKVRKNRVHLEMLQRAQQFSLLDQPDPKMHVKFNAPLKTQINRKREEALMIKYGHRWTRNVFRKKVMMF